jgi:hypothetical protein
VKVHAGAWQVAAVVPVQFCGRAAPQALLAQAQAGATHLSSALPAHPVARAAAQDDGAVKVHAGAWQVAAVVPVQFWARDGLSPQAPEAQAQSPVHLALVFPEHP